MDRLEALPPPPASSARTVGLVLLRAYLALAVVALSIRVARIVLGG
jgi:hypothetical protein